MNKIDHLSLDGSTLHTFLTVLDENSVSKAALKLKISQSAVSHTLDKLRVAFDDPLFVRDGRGITPTEKAKSLKEPISKILGELKKLTYKDEFNPTDKNLEFTIAANDFITMLIFPSLVKQMQSEGINPRFHFVPSGVPSANASRARTSRCQLLITPAPPTGKDYIVKELIESDMVCFYDSDFRNAPRTQEEFINSQYVDVKFGNTESSMMVLPLLYESVSKQAKITVHNFGVLPSFIKGSNLITTQLTLMRHGLMKGLASAPLPFETNPVKLYMVWHQHDQGDPAQSWLRQRIISAFETTFSS